MWMKVVFKAFGHGNKKKLYQSPAVTVYHSVKFMLGLTSQTGERRAESWVVEVFDRYSYYIWKVTLWCMNTRLIMLIIIIKISQVRWKVQGRVMKVPKRHSSTDILSDIYTQGGWCLLIFDINYWTIYVLVAGAIPIFLTCQSIQISKSLF